MSNTATPGRKKILGIDLGTTNSAMAVWDGHKPRIILNEQHHNLFPSVVGFTADGDVLVGERARDQALHNPGRTIFSAKRFIGRKFRGVAEDRKAVPYEVVPGEHGEAMFKIDDLQLSPEQIAARLLRTMKETAEAELGESITDAVITVPAYFNNPQREATKEAGKLAGLDVRRIVNEPTAAALAYGLEKIEDRASIVAVYDFGGGTFDVSVLSVGDDIVEVISTHGDTHLGGDDIDAAVGRWILDEATAQGITVGENPETLEQIRLAARAAKERLTAETSTQVRVELPAAGGCDAAAVTTTLTREKFEALISELVDRTISCCLQALEDAKKLPEEVDEVVLVGGSSRIPFVRRRVTELFGRKPRDEVNPDEVVALGAAVQAGILAGEIKGVVLVDVTSLSLGIQNHEGRSVVVIPRNTSIPGEAMRVFTTPADDQTSLRFHVVQGESEVAAENESLGQFDLVGLPGGPAGQLRIEVTFSIDTNGVVQVQARDMDTGLAQSVVVTTATQMAPQATGTAMGPQDQELIERAADLLEVAQNLLQTPGRKMTGVDRASLTKRTSQLRVFLAGPASREEIENARVALESVVEKVKAYRPPRGNPPSVAHSAE